jgi:hypothetical protein
MALTTHSNIVAKRRLQAAKPIGEGAEVRIVCDAPVEMLEVGIETEQPVQRRRELKLRSSPIEGRSGRGRDLEARGVRRTYLADLDLDK